VILPPNRRFIYGLNGATSEKTGSVEVKALCYKLEGRGFDTR
jgi:hypothetical protein